MKINRVLGINFLVFAVGFLSIMVVHGQKTNSSLPLSERVEIKNADYSMGKILSGKPVEYIVTVKNISLDTLSIQRVKAGCGCTIPKYTPGKVLNPGEETTITLGFDGKTVGPFTKFADVFMGNGQSFKLKFSGEATVN